MQWSRELINVPLGLFSTSLIHVPFSCYFFELSEHVLYEILEFLPFLFLSGSSDGDSHDAIISQCNLIYWLVYRRGGDMKGTVPLLIFGYSGICLGLFLPLGLGLVYAREDVLQIDGWLGGSLALSSSN